MSDTTAPVIKTNIPELFEKYLGTLSKRIPCKSNRASSIGYFVPELGGCIRQGVYERTHWSEKRLPDTRLQAIFEEGKEQEKMVLKLLAEIGVELFEQQGAFEWEKYNITGHLDGCMRDGNDSIPVEIKSMNPNIFHQINSLEDFKKKPWTTAYLGQIQLYMLFKNIDRGIFLLKDKSNGMLKQIPVALDYELAEACIKTAEIINKHVAEGKLPEPCDDIDKCEDCKFNHICMPERSFGTPLKISDDPLFDLKLLKYFELEEAAGESKELYETIRSRSLASSEGGDLNLLTCHGKVRIIGKRDKKGSLRLSFERL